MLFFESTNDFTTTLRKALDEIDPGWEAHNGLIIPGSHTPYMVEEKLDAIKEAREAKIPFLGICFGYQLAAIEYARNIMGIKDATSEEFGEGTFVVKKRSLKVGEQDGETWWANYEVNLDWEEPQSYYVTPSHPEYQSTAKRPAPLLLHFIQNFNKNIARKAIWQKGYK
jgi:CTP synthase (UTP-ammonia lyase)